MIDVVDTLREGDVYRWSYRGPGDDRNYGRYHCCSRIAVVRGGRLRDTFWSYGGDGRSFGLDDLPKLELTFLANMADLELVEEYRADYYDDSDIIDLNHSNSTRGNFFLRKGAKRSASKMLTVAKKKLEQADSAERMAKLRIKELRATIAKIEAGEIEIYI